jgi:hypothetical protein
MRAIKCLGIGAAMVVSWSAPAIAFNQGAVGDSISVGTDANDNCNTTASCGLQLGNDTDFSWTTGTFGGGTGACNPAASPPTGTCSMRGHWTPSTVNKQQVVGTRWQDANGQASAFDSTIDRVTIEMGGNDVCQVSSTTLPSKATIDGYVRSTFSTLVNSAASCTVGSTCPSRRVALAGVPHVKNLYNTMNGQNQFLFQTCQDLWNVDTTRLHVTAFAGGFCNVPFFGTIACAVGNATANFLAQVTGDFITPFKNIVQSIWPSATFPCSVMLQNNKGSYPSGSFAQEQALADQLNSDINTAIQCEVWCYNNNTSNVAYKSTAPSGCTCASPSPGQYKVAF